MVLNRISLEGTDMRRDPLLQKNGGEVVEPSLLVYSDCTGFDTRLTIRVDDSDIP